MQADLEGAPSAAGARLQTVAAQRSGSPEELVAIFVATLRAAGLLVRFVRCENQAVGALYGISSAACLSEQGTPPSNGVQPDSWLHSFRVSSPNLRRTLKPPYCSSRPQNAA